MWSNDQGETWSDPGPTEFASPTSPMSMKRMPPDGRRGGGDLLAVWNDHSGRFALDAERGRQPLTSAISQDEGKSWTNHKLVESDLSRGYHYTAIYFVGDHVLLAYCAGPKGTGRQLNTLRTRRIPRKWFYET